MFGWLKRRWSEQVPEWGEPLGLLGFVAMLEAIEAELGRRALPYKRNDATIAIATGGKLVLPTLVRRYAEIPQARWRQHTVDVIDAALGPKARRRAPLRFAAVRDQLRIQLAEHAPCVRIVAASAAETERGEMRWDRGRVHRWIS